MVEELLKAASQEARSAKRQNNEEQKETETGFIGRLDIQGVLYSITTCEIL